MQSKAAKIIFLILVALTGIGVFWLYNYGPESFSHNETRKQYETYIRAEGKIITKESRGSVTRKNITWIVQFKDKNNNLQTVKILDNTTTGKDIGEEVIVYYNPKDPHECVDDESYNKVM